ncbi:helix-turn-helix domain-containing protein [Enterococcus sp. AZ172]|uniref:helix-turn-helix domain-containing protein n=1 Tax=unclassified Enterococcus TaxID=2608891 RepID=UPI003E16F9BC
MISIINFLEKQTERQINIVLLVNKDINDINLIADQLHVIDKTILGDIDDFNEKYSPAELRELENKKIILNLPSDMSLSDLFSKILNASTTVQALKMIFERELTIKELSKEIFVSETSIRRMISRTNLFFKEKNLKIEIESMPSLSIQGDEKQIREFFCQMYLEIYDQTSLPQYTLIYDALFQCNRLFSNSGNQNEQLYLYLKLVFFLLIGIIRIGKNHYNLKSKNIRPIGDDVVNQIYNVMRGNPRLCDVLKQEYGFEIDKFNIQDLLNVNASYISHNIVDYQELNQEEKQLYRLTIQFFHQYFERIDLSYLLTPEKKSALYRIVLLSSNRNSFMIDYHEIFYYQIVKRSPWLIDQFEKEFIKSGLSSIIPFSSARMKEIFIEMYMDTEELIDIVEPSLKEKSIAIFFNSNKGVEKLYKKLIKQRYPFLKKLDIYKGEDTLIDYTYLNQYDLVLAENSLDMEQLNADFLKISRIPTDNFWEHFHSKLY